MYDDDIFKGTTYQLVEMLKHDGLSKKEGSRSEQEQYDFWCGCYTDFIRFQQLYRRKEDEEPLYCLQAHFTMNADGIYVDRSLRTSPILDAKAEGASILIRTVNTIYVFEEAELPKQEYRKTANLTELWMGSGDHRFDRGVHYDAERNPHELTVMPHIGTFQDSFLICYRGELQITVGRYFKNFRSVEWYQALPAQDDYTIPMWIHNTAAYPLTIRFPFCDRVYVIKPGEDELIRLPGKW